MGTALLLAGLLGTALAGPGKAKDPDAPGPRVQLTDRSQLCSTYGFPAEARARLLAASDLTDAQIDALLPLADEDQWPEGWQTLDGRGEHETHFPELVVYQLAVFDGGCGDTPETYLLLAPAAENQHLPPIVRPSQDFYIFVGSESVAAWKAEPEPKKRKP